MGGRINLDLDTLRTLVTAQQRGGLAQAAKVLGRTPSAISLQIKRLQQDLGVTLYRRQGRGLVLTEAGEATLAYARRMLALNDELLESMHGASVAGHIRLGCPQDLAPLLPAVLSRFALLYPRMQIELHVEGSNGVVEGVQAGRLDLALAFDHAQLPGAREIGRMALVWIASSGSAVDQAGQVPLAVMGAQCAFRRAALQELERAGRAYRIAAHSPSLNGLWAAIAGGIGVTVRTGFHLPDGLQADASLAGLPAMGSLAVTLHQLPQSDHAAVARMATLLEAELLRHLAPAALVAGALR